MNESENHQPLLEREERVLIITRRLFVGDARRHFIGSIERYDSGAIRVRGYAFVYDTEKGSFVKRKSQRTRVFPLVDHIVVFILPYDTDLSAVRYELTEGSGLVVTDGKQFTLEVGEFNT